MRTPKRCYPAERLIDHPELLPCPHGGDVVVMCNSLAWEKTVHTLDRVLSVASRPGRGPHTTCLGSRMRLLSATAQHLAVPGSTDGSDVLVRLAWGRQESRAPDRALHPALAAQVRLSASHVGDRSPQVSLPLLAGHERQHRDHLAQIAQEPGGLMLARDGLAPQGGAPHIGVLRALPSGVPLRRGWLAQQAQPPFAALLQPLTPLAWPLLAVRSDKHKGLVLVVAPVCPNRRYQVCQAHSLRTLAAPLAEADAALQGELRPTGRQQVGGLSRQEPHTAPGHAGVFTVTGLLPSPLAQPTAPASQRPPPRAYA